MTASAELTNAGLEIKKKIQSPFATGYENLVASSRILIAKLTNHN